MIHIASQRVNSFEGRSYKTNKTCQNTTILRLALKTKKSRVNCTRSRSDLSRETMFPT